MGEGISEPPGSGFSRVNSQSFHSTRKGNTRHTLFCNVAWLCKSLQHMHRLHNCGTHQRTYYKLVITELQISALQHVGRIPLVARDASGNALFVKFNVDNFINRWVACFSWTGKGRSFPFSRNDGIHQESKNHAPLCYLLRTHLQFTAFSLSLNKLVHSDIPRYPCDL
jgi:hypothetical protein